MPLTFLFGALQVPLLMKYAVEPAPAEEIRKPERYVPASAFSISGFTTRSRFSGVSGPTSL